MVALAAALDAQGFAARSATSRKLLRLSWPEAAETRRALAASSCAMVGHGVRDNARNRAPPLRRVRFCSGRRPAAAPAMFRRCRDGWSDSF
ncbi:hypothetical protein F511_47304 [Dorcoceras hygrometricum]|uniref:Uncharacterized protein n=1 Tax=Dorcoceras hygrometricum TaxID=472368 RepID=A0A2Z6ZSF7_9LAMI|nr:hypothetical protein F511_47304 [Dorcoceras hygrometricum]